MKKLYIFISIFVCQFYYFEANPQKNSDWWQTTVFYQIYPRSFKDSDGDGVGDLKGIISKLSHLKHSGIRATWLSPIFQSPMVDFGYDISNFTAIHDEYGTMEDFEDLINEATKLGIKIILDFVPNHSSDLCEWFIKSANREKGFEDFYVWNDGIIDKDGKHQPPNNWQSVFYGSAWTWNDKRKQFYLHQFAAGQPDLNFRNKKVIDAMDNVLKFWLNKGVYGFRIDAVNHLFEVQDLRDEPETGIDLDPNSYGFTHHYYTKDLPEAYEMIYHWRELLDNYKIKNGGETRIMMTEAYANLTFTMDYYENENGRKGAHFPFNFLLITDLNKNSDARDFVYNLQKWLAYMPLDGTPNWVLGNHDNSRVGSRFGCNKIDAMNMLLLTLPGVAVTYNGEEIGMINNDDITWEETKDPAACNTNSKIFHKFTRDPERSPFQWDSTENGGFSSGKTTWLPVNKNYKKLNLAVQEQQQRSHYNLYKQLVNLRNAPTFKYGNFLPKALNRHVLVFKRELKDHPAFLTVINLGNNDEIVDLSNFGDLPEKLFVVVAGSESTYYEGDEIPTKKMILSKYAGLVLTTHTH